MQQAEQPQKCRCAHCKKWKNAELMDTAMVYMGKDVSNEHNLNILFDDFEIYRMSNEALHINICKECVKGEQVTYILITIGCIIGGGLLLYFGWQYKWNFFVLFAGGVIASTGVAMATKMNFTKENMADQLGVKHIQSQFSNKTHPKEKLRILTRHEYKKLIPGSF